MAEVTSLRKAKNEVWITGVLEEKNIEIKPVEFTNKISGTKQTTDQISGTLTINVNGNKIKVSMRANALKTDGNPNGLYAGYKTVKEEYVSRAEAIARGDENLATIIKVKGELNPYDAVDKRTFEIYTPMYIKGTYFNRGEITDTHRATFVTEIFIESVAPEQVDGKETGRAVVEGILPLYGGVVEPVRFVAGEEEKGNVGKFILENYEAGKTYQVRGDIKSVITHKDYTKEGMFGTETTTFESIKTEFVLNSYSDVKAILITDPRSYDKNTIKAAMLHRQEKNDARIAKERANADSGNIPPEFTSFASPFAGKVEPMTEQEINEIEF